MGETLQHMNYWVILIFFILLLCVFLLNKNRFNKINLMVFLMYSFLFVIFQSNDYFSLYQITLLHFTLSAIHLSLVLIVNLFFIFKR